MKLNSSSTQGGNADFYDVHVTSGAALEEAQALEAQICKLIDEFEQKHSSIQVKILTRVRNYRDKYKMAKGGSAQILLHNSAPMLHLGSPVVRLTDVYTNPDENIFYTDSGL
jgi:hypothetical protein